MRANSPARHRTTALVGPLVGLLVAIATLSACSSSSRALPSTTSGKAGATTTAPSNNTGSTGVGSTAPTTSATSTTTTVAPTTTLPIVTAPGKVKVANASGINGAAGQLSVQLSARGFTLTKPTNSFGPDKDLKVSKIYVVKGSEKVADSVSRLMGGVKVYRMPTPAWIVGGTAALEGATVLVMLGGDRADKKLSEMAG